MFKLGVGAAAVAGVSAKTYLKETFNSASWTQKWTEGSDWKSSSEMGTFERTKGEFGVDEGIKTGPDARFFSITAPLDETFDNKGKDLVIAMTVRHEQNLDCGGAYIKLLPGGFDAKKFGGATPYSVMFGPDLCGTGTRKTHAIFTYPGKDGKDVNFENKKNIRVETDRNPHRYTLIVRPDNTYEVQIDGSKAESGSLLDDYSFLAPKTIKDPEAKKPADWVDEAQILDPEDKKPEGYDDVPAKIPDPNAKKPEDWQEEDDGEWEAPMIDNPEFKGVWTQKRIPNPGYKGPWVAPEIANPEYKEDANLYNFCKGPCAAVGFELWQVKAGTVFDDIIVTDSIAEAEAFAAETFEKKKDAEKKAKDDKEEADRKKAEEERKKAEEESKKQADEAKAKTAGGDDDEDESEL